tara:strand:+ start:94 stop:348 length:255 start_codon:yes stop_codon:yes gene_type:complete
MSKEFNSTKAQIELVYKEWDSDKKEYVAQEGFQWHGFNFEEDSVVDIKHIAVRIISDLLNCNREEFKHWCDQGFYDAKIIGEGK